MQQIIENAWESKDFNSPSIYDAVHNILNDLDGGKIRVAEKKSNNTWQVNEWIKKAILISFRINDSALINKSSAEIRWFDKVQYKFHNWSSEEFTNAKIRAVPGCFVRKGSYVAPDVVLMPSFINIGAYVGSNTMVDTWATIGSCAQIGKNCHISGGSGIAGVLEPLQSNPVIIEDNCFIGARSEVAEGAIIREGSVLAMGVFISASTKIIDRESGKIYQGEVPPYSVVVPGSYLTKNNISLSCAVIVKIVDEQTRSKTSINELLRD